MKGLMMHCGGKYATMDDLALVPVPDRTDTYTPLPYPNLVNLVRELATSRLGDFKAGEEYYGLNKTGSQMFGLMRFSHPNDSGMGLAIGMRTSYDKSVATSLCAGGDVFVCDNMCFSGKIHVARRHTGEFMLSDLESMIIRALYSSTNQFQSLVADRERMIQTPIDNRLAYYIIMSLYVQGNLGATQFNKAKDNWHFPPYEEFEPRSAWSLYNSINDALKTSRATDIFENHIALHRLVLKEIAAPDPVEDMVLELV